MYNKINNAFMISARQTQHKGDTAVAQAIATFTHKNYDVFLPLTESASYDLVIDTPEGLKRIQVKYSSGKDVDLRRIHSNSRGYVVKKSRENAYDWLYILRGDGKEYLIKSCLYNRRSIKPTLKYLLQ